MPSNALQKLKSELKHAAGVKSPEKRGIYVAAVISKALRPLGEDPVLVGGGAVAFYTDARYTTSDIDMIVFGGPEATKVMKSLGFRQRGKDYVHDKLGLYVEFPSATLNPGERSVTLTIGGDTLRIISVEDLVIDRLNHYKYFKSAVDALNVMMLLELPDIDRAEIEKKAQTQDTLDALDHIEKVQTRVIREKLSKKEASKLLEVFIRR